MGMDRQEFVGPYFRCTTVLAPVAEQIKACGNTSCKQHGKQVWDRKVRFCPACGTTVGPFTIHKEAPKAGDPWEVSEDTGDMICLFRGEGWEGPPDVHIFIPNCYDIEAPLKRSFNIDEQESGEWEIDEQTITSEVMWLKTDFAQQYTYLQNRYGVENVRICWGILAAWS